MREGAFGKIIGFTRNAGGRFWAFLFVLHMALRWAALGGGFLDVDESQFAGFAHVLMDGGLPYRDSLDTKPLGIYLYYWANFALFGRYSLAGVHIATALWNFAGAALLAALVKSLSGRLAGRMAAFFYVVFATTFIPKYLGTSINAVMAPWLILSAFLALTGPPVPCARRAVRDAAAGSALGIALLFKYQAGIQLPWLALIASPLLSRDANWKFWLKRCLIYGVFFILPFVFHSLVLLKLGVWGDFYEWSVMGSARYISGGGRTIPFWNSFATRFLPYVAATLPLWLLPFAAGRFAKTETGGAFGIVVTWLLFNLVPAAISGRFYSHYFLQFLPMLCALAGVSFSALCESPVKFARVPLKSALAFAAVSAVAFWGVRFDMESYHRRFADDDLPAQKRVGERVRELSRPEEKIFVWGFATAVYFHSQRAPASRFLWSDWLTGRVPGPSAGRLAGGKDPGTVSPEAWSALWEDFAARPPAFFIDTAPAGMHGYADYPVALYPPLREYLEKHYDKAESVAGCDIYARR